ncbi:uncharacterized protein V1518DRAFT_419484 [Limtongia smithiae]|uniref:uncharacterized protein n=1 Tax=Limtongia smithiae TaxID=1125753 RepID=UPI0034CE640A
MHDAAMAGIATPMLFSAPRLRVSPSQSGAGAASAPPAASADSSRIPMIKYFVPAVHTLATLRAHGNNWVGTELYRVTGYEVYIVEQWACRRSLNPTVICYTGNPQHSVVVGCVTVPKSPARQNPKVRSFIAALSQTNAMPKLYGDEGILLVTNLSSFPSGLTLIGVPDGDVARHWPGFVLSENLRRMSCGARSGLTLNPPSDASRDKFYQLFRLSDRVPFEDAVIELIILVQKALYYFALFHQHDIDGLLCDRTEKKINTWWHDIGKKRYGADPSDKGLGTTTVAALLGMVVGCRHRLYTAGAPVPKDAFDISRFLLAIEHFQKSSKLKLTHRLDTATIEKLFTISGKITASERFALTKVVKNTVQDLSGFHTRNAVDVETTDYDRFIENAYGRSLRYLFLGKGNSAREAATINDQASVKVLPPVSTATGLSNTYQPQRKPLNAAPTQYASAEEQTPVILIQPPASSASSLTAVEDHDEIDDSSSSTGTDPFNRHPDDNEDDDNANRRRRLSLVDEISGYRYIRHSRTPSEANLPSDVAETPTALAPAQANARYSKDLKYAMRWGKNKTDVALRSGVTKLAGNLRRGGRKQKTTPDLKQTAVTPEDDDDKSYIEGDRDANEDDSELSDNVDTEDDDLDSQPGRQPPTIGFSASSAYNTDDEGDDTQAAPQAAHINMTAHERAAYEDSKRLCEIQAELALYHHSDHRGGGPRRAKSCGGLLDATVDEAEHDTMYREKKLLRRGSFSDAANAVLRRGDATDYSVAYVLQILERVGRAREWSKRHLDDAESLLKDYDIQLKSLDSFHGNAASQQVGITKAYSHGMQRATFLAKGIQDLDASASRLQYELRTLDSKLGDLEDSVVSFGTKLAIMESRLQGISRAGAATAATTMEERKKAAPVDWKGTGTGMGIDSEQDGTR